MAQDGEDVPPVQVPAIGQLALASPDEQPDSNQPEDQTVSQDLGGFTPGPLVMSELQFAAEYLNQNEKNSREIQCQYCGSCVMKPDTATLERMHFTTHPIQRAGQEGAVGSGPQDLGVQQTWLITNRMDFWNVGVTKAVGGSIAVTPPAESGVAPDADPNYRYLTCADCDAGPIGVAILNHDKFYVLCGRVVYK